MTDYAVLIIGDSPNLERSYNGGRDPVYDEFWNDTYLMWEILYTKTGMQDSSSSVVGQIRVLYTDGVDYPGATWRYRADNPNHPVLRVTDYSATYVDVANIFTWLRDGNQQQAIPHPMNEYEELFCWTFDHGRWNGTNAYLGLRDVWVRYDHESQPETPQFSDVGNIAATTFLDYAPPTAPPNLTGYWNINGVFLDWDPSTDNETAVKHYLIKRTPAFPYGQIDSIATLTQFWDWTVKSHTSYNYRIFAFDLTLNISPQCSINIKTGYVNPPIPLSGGPQIASEQTMGSPGFVNISQNPVRKNAVITFSTPDPGCVNVAIYDVQGKKVREILNAYRPAGIHGINFEVENIESGVYFVRLNTHNFSDVQKLIIAK